VAVPGVHTAIWRCVPISRQCRCSKQQEHSRALAKKLDLTFALLSDVGNQVARQFGLVFTIDEAVRAPHLKVGANLPQFNGDSSWELPMAGTFLVDQTGTIRLACVDPDFTRRLDPSILIARLKELRG
jgi:peroxiredoxin